MDKQFKKIVKEIRVHYPELSDESAEIFLKNATYVQHKNKETILTSELSSTHSFLVVKGCAKGYYIDKNKQEKIVVLVAEGDFGGDSTALFNHQAAKLTFESIGKTNVIVFNFSELESISNQNKELGQLYVQSLKRTIAILTERIDSMINMTHEERYIDLLEKNPLFLKSVFDKHIANYIGITPVSLSRIIKRVEENQVKQS
ncbi:Crp/Fnr family transcriptional regulator [Namhaeicola litoreus]|uniref:Crp/Fnr family transcriptional regulator n=1 Tax=Namhaeicola litoreus TaxID=1052145 RepID=A0ABW3Y3G5_9FLAO